MLTHNILFCVCWVYIFSNSKCVVNSKLDIHKGTNNRVLEVPSATSRLQQSSLLKDFQRAHISACCKLLTHNIQQMQSCMHFVELTSHCQFYLVRLHCLHGFHLMEALCPNRNEYSKPNTIYEMLLGRIAEFLWMASQIKSNRFEFIM